MATWTKMQTIIKKPLLVKYNELSLELLNLQDKNNKNKNVEIEL